MILVAAFLMMAQDPPPSARVRNEVHVRIREQVEEERPHDHYRQAAPVDHRVNVEGLRGSISGRVTLHTECESVQESPPDELIFLAPTPAEFPVSFSIRLCAMTLVADVSASLVAARQRTFGYGTGGQSPVVPPLPTVPTPSVPVPPPAPRTLSYSTSPGSGEDSDSPLLAGPEIDLVLLRDVANWPATAWLPGTTSLHLVGRVLLGRMELFENSEDVGLYELALGLQFPLVRAGGFSCQAGVSAGPGFLKTGRGDVTGVHASAGLQARQEVSGGFSFYASAEAERFEADGVSGFGPSFNFGVNLSW